MTALTALHVHRTWHNGQSYAYLKTEVHVWNSDCTSKHIDDVGHAIDRTSTCVTLNGQCKHSSAEKWLASNRTETFLLTFQRNAELRSCKNCQDVVCQTMFVSLQAIDNNVTISVPVTSEVMHLMLCIKSFTSTQDVICLKHQDRHWQSNQLKWWSWLFLPQIYYSLLCSSSEWNSSCMAKWSHTFSE